MTPRQCRCSTLLKTGEESPFLVSFQAPISN